MVVLQKELEVRNGLVNEIVIDIHISKILALGEGLEELSEA